VEDSCNSKEDQSSQGTRLHVWVARKPQEALILRCGPPSQFQLIRWDLQHNTFETGQWFKGEIQPGQCDLSPDGAFWLYSATIRGEVDTSWTAVSRPPWFAPIAIWNRTSPSRGGGFFAAPRHIVLNHNRAESNPHTQYLAGASQFRVSVLSSQVPEDEKRAREGWHRLASDVWARDIKNLRLLMITRRRSGAGEWGRATYRLERLGECVVDLGTCDWADLDSKGNLLYSNSGCLFRIGITRGRPAEPAKIADFRSNTYEDLTPPWWAVRI
jgi:hypothetical protein